jgi:5-formyltetrahydrofolate cyclo-ligase
MAPVLRADGDLDWAPYAPGDALLPGLRGTVQPATAVLGTGAVAGAGLVVVPALAVDRTGNRLGRGGGGYDRALARRRDRAGTGPGAVVAVVFADELLDEVPTQPHDQPVDAILTTGGLAAVTRGRAGGPAG